MARRKVRLLHLLMIPPDAARGVSPSLAARRRVMSTARLQALALTRPPEAGIMQYRNRAIPSLPRPRR